MSIEGELNAESEIFSRRQDAYYVGHRFTGKANQLISISLTSDEFDTYLFLVDSQGNILSSNDDGGLGVNSKLVFQLPTDGVYEAIATTFSVGQIGKYTIAVSSDNTSLVLTGHQGSVLQMAFSPEGNQIATSGADGTARLWDLNGNQIAQFDGHQGSVLQVAFSPEGNQIATSGADGTARLWDLNGNQIAQFEGENGTISDDWKHIAVTEDSVISLWPVYTLNRLDELLASACEHLGPYLTNNPDPRYSDDDRALCGIAPLQ